MHKAVFIVPVKEGFISLPYDEVDKEDYELLELDDAVMLDEDSLAVFKDDFKMFADDLLTVLVDMLLIVRSK